MGAVRPRRLSVALLLLLLNLREERSEDLVVRDRRLVHPRVFDELPRGQGGAFELDDDLAVVRLAHEHLLTRRAADEFAAVEQVHHALVVQRQVLRHSPLFLPREHVIKPFVRQQRPVRVMRALPLAREAPVQFSTNSGANAFAASTSEMLRSRNSLTRRSWRAPSGPWRHADDGRFGAVERHGLAVPAQVALGRCEVVERRLRPHEAQLHQPSRRVVHVHERRALRPAILEPVMLAPSICTNSPRQARR